MPENLYMKSVHCLVIQQFRLACNFENIKEHLKLHATQKKRIKRNTNLVKKCDGKRPIWVTGPQMGE
jgi:hypothetical protein